MSDYWGAKADPNVGYSPYSGQTHYGSHQLSSEPFTPEATDGTSGMKIEEIEMRIHNMHPEQISALADQWLNAWTLLSQVHDYVLEQSNVLNDETWKSPKARDAFMQKGPGEALAYLDLWMDAAMTNYTALRQLVNVAQEARDEIDEIVRKYKEDLANADDNVDFGDQVGEWVQGFTVTWDEAKDREIRENIDNARKYWTHKAQVTAKTYGDQYYEYVKKLNSGMGPPVQPMNAVLNNPGHPPLPKIPNLPIGGTPPAPPPAVPPPATPPVAPPPPPVDPTQLAQDQPPPPPPKPDSTVAPPPVAPPVAPPAPVPVLSVLPPPPPGFGKNPTGLPNGALKPGSLPPGLKQSGPAPSTLPTAKPPNPGQLTKNAFQKSGATPPGANQPPGKTLRRPTGEGGHPGQPGARDVQRKTNQPGRPGAHDPHQPGRPGERRKGDRPDTTNRTPGTPVDSDEAFGRPTGSAPPVLKNPTGDRTRRRPGSADELRPAAYGNADDALRRDGAAPPVLNRPSRPGDAAPTQPTRRHPERDRKTTAPAAEWVGADEARAEAGASVLDAPVRPPTGSRVSRLEEVPKDLRSPAAARDAARPQHARPGSVSPELSKRRTDRTWQAEQVDDEARGLVTDERAFDVATPGGGVVTSKRDEPVYEPEQRRAFGGQ